MTSFLRNGPRSTRARTIRTAALLAALVTVATCGCGIRTTTVPVDAGPAPTRVSCAVPQATVPPETPGTTVVKVYLVCSALAAQVTRNVTTTDTGTRPAPVSRLIAADMLLGQLQRRPSAVEAEAGFATEVPGNLNLTGPLPGDPKDALRLSLSLDELPSFALAQLVCTFTAAPGVGLADRSVLLGGPPGEGGPVKRYLCTSALRTRPDAADTAGTVVK
ncbi:hypothetical protein ACIGXA_04040 [Streptomyces fildesensis]|uniref:Lipoprotein n=1 Tax=Streptomyces fildesensis TaxID=375757 RepID=A0ABW8C1A5_9ACTN